MKLDVFITGLNEFGTKSGPEDAVSEIGQCKKTEFTRGVVNPDSPNPLITAISDFETTGGESAEIHRIGQEIKQELSIVFSLQFRQVDQSEEKGPVMVTKITVFSPKEL